MKKSSQAMEFTLFAAGRVLLINLTAICRAVVGGGGPVGISRFYVCCVCIYDQRTCRVCYCHGDGGNDPSVPSFTTTAAGHLRVLAPSAATTHPHPTHPPDTYRHARNNKLASSVVFYGLFISSYRTLTNEHTHIAAGIEQIIILHGGATQIITARPAAAAPALMKIRKMTLPSPPFGCTRFGRKSWQLLLFLTLLILVKNNFQKRAKI